MPKGVRLGGRAAGTPNKLTKDVREMILAALNKKGGQKYLEAQATENPTAFMTLIGKCLPQQHTGLNGNPIAMEHKLPDIGPILKRLQDMISAGRS